MKVTVLLGIVGGLLAIVVDPAITLPLQAPLDPSNYLIVQPAAAAANYASYPQYFVYNVPQVNTPVRTYPTAVFTNGRPTIAHIPTSYNYYGTPIYDFRFPINPINRLPFPASPGNYPRPQYPDVATYPSPPDDNDDGIEKLDAKVDPNLEHSSNTGEETKNLDESVVDDDTVSIVAKNIEDTKNSANDDDTVTILAAQ